MNVESRSNLIDKEELFTFEEKKFHILWREKSNNKISEELNFKIQILMGKFFACLVIMKFKDSFIRRIK